jgi:ubiquitin C-terminal hydrolase
MKFWNKVYQMRHLKFRTNFHLSVRNLYQTRKKSIKYSRVRKLEILRFLSVHEIQVTSVTAQPSWQTIITKQRSSLKLDIKWVRQQRTEEALLKAFPNTTRIRSRNVHTVHLVCGSTSLRTAHFNYLQNCKTDTQNSWMDYNILFNGQKTRAVVRNLDMRSNHSSACITYLPSTIRIRYRMHKTWGRISEGPETEVQPPLVIWC